MAECSVDAVLGDPPYGLEFMGIEFDKLGQAHQMQSWHRQWAEAVLRVLKPGGFLFAFGGSRTEHRLVCGIEDAGFGIRDKIYWHFGSGFPKSTDIAKQLDKRAGAEREVVSEGAGYEAAPDRATYGHGLNVGFLPRQVTAPATPEAKRWDGWGTALKPATETVVIAMKPLDGTFAENALRWKVAGLNIDGGRIPSSGEHMRGFVAGMTAGGMTAGDTRTGKSLGRFEAGRAFQATDHPSGRWPANLVLVHSPGCVRRGKEKVKGHKHSGKPGHGKDGQVYGRGIVFGGDTQCYADPDGLEEVEEWSCVEGCPVLELARQSGERPSGAIRKEVQAAKFGTHGIYGEGKGCVGRDCGASNGTAARFYYCAKAHGRERSMGLVECLPRCRSPRRRRQQDISGQWARRAVNRHPTVKPLELCKYLATLLLPPKRETPRRILVPFSGSGSEMIGCLLAGWDEVVGIEKDAGYVAVARARLEWWRRAIGKYGTPLEPKLVLEEKSRSRFPPAPVLGQMEMF